jgi:3-oxoacyl-(acyl-carrier-protein) synthase
LTPVITQLAVLTPLGDSLATWDAICAGKRIGERVAVADALLDPDTTLDRSIRLALTAAREVHNGSEDVQLFCGTSKGPVGTYLSACEKLARGEALDLHQAEHIALGVGAVGAIVRRKLKLHPPAHTSVAACSSGLHALHRAASAIRHGECQRALVVAADASLHPLFAASFDRLGVLAKPNDQGVRTCEPFGETGGGFFLVEAAAAIMLEAPAALADRQPIAWLENSWIGADSTDLIAIDPLTQTLRHGLSSQQPPAFVHAHATGTGHDRYELAAIRSALGHDVPVFSHKQYLGHSLGAAGLVSVVISALAHHHRRTPPGHPVPPNAASLTIAQGFGGHIGLIALRSSAGE